MGKMPSAEILGPPDIKISGLQIWVHGRQYLEAQNEDGNWLEITAVCNDNTSEVWTSGNILELLDLSNWLINLEKMNQNLTGEANLDPTEPELNIKLSMNKLGQMKMIVDITPDILMQTHHFQINLDQSYLPVLIEDVRKILSSYPIKSK